MILTLQRQPTNKKCHHTREIVCFAFIDVLIDDRQDN